MLTFPQIDPVAFSMGPLQVRWYGLMYLFGFLSAWLLARRRAKTPGNAWTSRELDDLLIFSMLGAIVGARLGYVLFYDLAYYLSMPLEIFKVWTGGMSFHGGLLGVLAAMCLVARQARRGFWETVDAVAPLAPPGLFFGRIGNFINGELYGRVTDSPLGMIFPNGGPLPRHPSQLYEACLEGIVLFILLWSFSAGKRPVGAVSGVFAIGYGVGRCIAEFFREPDAHRGFIAFGWLTTGQLLCLPLLLAGFCLLAYSYRRPAPAHKRR